MPKIIQQQPAASEREKRRTRKAPRAKTWHTTVRDFLPSMLQAISHFYIHTYWLVIFINTSLLSDSVFFSHPDMILFIKSVFRSTQIKSGPPHSLLYIFWPLATGAVCFLMLMRGLAALLTCKTTFRCWESILVCAGSDLDHTACKNYHLAINWFRLSVSLCSCWS